MGVKSLNFVTLLVLKFHFFDKNYFCDFFIVSFVWLTLIFILWLYYFFFVRLVYFIIFAMYVFFLFLFFFYLFKNYSEHDVSIKVFRKVRIY